MLPLFTRRVVLSSYRPNAIYSRILPSSASALRSRRIPDAGLHTRNARTSASSLPRRYASTKATATAKEAESSTKSSTAGRKQPVKKLTPEREEARRQRISAQNEVRKRKAERAAVLQAKRKARADKEKELAARKRKRLAEKRRKLAEAKEKSKAGLIKPPLRRINAYSLFVQESKKQVPEVALMWRNLSDATKEEYSARAKVAAEERKEAFNAFMKTVPRSDVARYNRVQRSKGKNAIRVKRSAGPLTSFMAYAKEFRTRPGVAGKPAVEVAKAAGEAWRSLTQEERDSYKYKPAESSTV